MSPHEPPRVEIYATRWCGYCRRAKSLLEAKGVAWREIDLDEQPQRFAEMEERSGGRHTVPQVFIDDRHVGGFDDLAALDRQGRLDALLGLA